MSDRAYEGYPLKTDWVIPLDVSGVNVAYGPFTLPANTRSRRIVAAAVRNPTATAYATGFTVVLARNLAFTGDRTALTDDIEGSTTTLPVSDSSIAGQDDYILIDDEVIAPLDPDDGTNILVSSRHVLGTAAAGHASGAVVSKVIPYDGATAGHPAGTQGVATSRIVAATVSGGGGTGGSLTALLLEPGDAFCVYVEVADGTGKAAELVLTYTEE